jgi:hypothetical protein
MERLATLGPTSCLSNASAVEAGGNTTLYDAMGSISACQ